MGFELTTLVAIGTDDIASCKSMTPPSTTLVTSWRPVLLLDKITDLLQISVKLYKKKLVSSTPQHRVVVGNYCRTNVKLTIATVFENVQVVTDRM